MELALFCSPDSNDVLKGLIEGKGFELNNRAGIAVVENGIALPANTISIVFDMKNMNQLSEFLDRLPAKKEGMKNAIVGKKGDKYEIINLEKVLYFEADGNEVYCHSANECFLVKSKLYELEESLTEKGFIRISKSNIVNILTIKEVIPWFDTRFVLNLINNREIEVSKKYSRKFKEFIGL